MEFASLPLNRVSPHYPVVMSAGKQRSAPLRAVWVSGGYGALAGAVAGLALMLMLALEHAVWSVSEARWYVFAAITVGGLLLAGLRSHTADEELDEQIAAAADPRSLRRRKVALLGASAIISVGFGGAIGPEAGLIAVVAELSALVSWRIARTQAEARMIGQAGNAAALAGLYASPPGAVAYEDDALTPSKALALLAAITGFLAFLFTLHLAGSDFGGLGIPAYPAGDPAMLVRTVPAAMAGTLVAVLFVRLRSGMFRLLSRWSSPVVQTLIGTALFAGLATAWPAVRFSGHAQFPELLDLVADRAWLVLAGLAVLKMLATALNLTSGWRGGTIFPLAFAGAAAGSACLAFTPDLHPSGALIAGMGAAVTVGLRRPLAALLICAFILEGNGAGPLLVGVAASLLLRAVPLPTTAAPATPSATAHPS